jgi:hypothetical protein
MKMKKIIWIALIIAVGVSIYIYSAARQKASLPRPEDMHGQEASPVMPEEDKNKPTYDETKKLKVTGPVWVEE